MISRSSMCFMCDADLSGGAKRATSAKVPLPRLQSSEGKFAMSREVEPLRRSFCRHDSCTLTTYTITITITTTTCYYYYYYYTITEVARLVPSGCIGRPHRPARRVRARAAFLVVFLRGCMLFASIGCRSSSSSMIVEVLNNTSG